MRVYIAGPMSGYPGLNFAAFNSEAAWLRRLGYDVVNPAELNGGADELEACKSMTATEMQAHWQKCMRNDITALMTCDAIQMLKGWEKSKGATLEHRIATALGLEVRYQPSAAIAA